MVFWLCWWLCCDCQFEDNVLCVKWFDLVVGFNGVGKLMFVVFMLVFLLFGIVFVNVDEIVK